MGPSELKQERSCGQGLTELWSLESLESHWGSGSPTLVPDDQCDTEGKGVFSLLLHRTQLGFSALGNS